MEIIGLLAKKVNLESEEKKSFHDRTP